MSMASFRWFLGSSTTTLSGNTKQFGANGLNGADALLPILVGQFIKIQVHRLESTGNLQYSVRQYDILRPNYPGSYHEF